MATWDMTTTPALLGVTATGEVTNNGTAAALPSKTGRIAMIRAVASNTGEVYIGLSGVTAEDGTTDTTTGMELSAKDSITVTLQSCNLNELYIKAATPGDGIVYMILG